MLPCLRILAVVIGAVAIVAETFRSWGVSRPVYAVVDDYLFRAFLILAAVRTKRAGGLAMLAAAFGFSAGLLYGSFFLHLSVWDQPDPGDIPQKILTALAGLGFAGSVIGVVLALWEAAFDDGARVRHGEGAN